MKKINLKLFVTCLIIVYAVAGIGSFFTSKNTSSTWYESIKPSITPPNYVFPIVWSILFFLIALSLYFTWNDAKNRKTKEKIKWIFGINFALNIFWSAFYFGMKNPVLAYYDLIALWASICIMILFTSNINRKASYLLIPYLIWVAFAGILNYLSAF